MYRRIHDSATTSQSLANCSRDARHVFLMLPLAMDYWGRGIDDPMWLLAKLFPLCISDYSPAEVGQWMSEWEREGMIVRYRAGGRKYFMVVNWDQYQPDCIPHRQRSGCRPLPAPPDGEERHNHAAGIDSQINAGIDSQINDPKMAPETEPEPEPEPEPDPEPCPDPEILSETSTTNRAGTCAGGRADRSVGFSPSASGDHGASLANVPPEVRIRAEQIVGHPLSSSDQIRLVQISVRDKIPAGWFIRACDDVAVNERRPKRPLAYVQAILANWKTDGGPPQPSVETRSRSPDARASPAPMPPVTLTPDPAWLQAENR